MGILKRAIAKDASVVATAVDATDIVAEIEKIHQTSAVVTAALGRLSIAASMMGYDLKNENDTVTLRVKGGGPAGMLVAVADSRGNVKADVDQPVVELPLNAKGKLDVGGAVGTCLAGDVIGDYSFDAPLTEGDRLLFGDMAIYTTCKNNTFNGMPLPPIWTMDAAGTCRQLVKFGYEDFKMRVGNSKK